MEERKAWVRKKSRQCATVFAIATLLAGCRSLPSNLIGEDSTTFISPQDQIIEVDPSALPRARALALYSRALSLELQQKHDEALDTYREALTYDQNEPDLYRRIAVNLIRRNEIADAVSMLEELIAKHPEHADAHTWLATAHRRAGNTEQAESHYRRAIELAPGQPGVYMQLVDLFLQANQPDQAVEILEQGAARVRDNTDLHRVLAELYMRQVATHPGINDENQERVNRATAVLEDALTIQPSDPQLLSSLADLHLRAGHMDKAIPLLEKILTVEPDEVEVMEKLAVAHEASGDLEQAAKVLEEMARIRPTNVRLFMALGGMYERMEDVERALLNYGLAARLSPPDESPFLRMTLIQMETDPQAALDAVEEGLQMFPDSPRLLEMKGYVQFGLEEYEQAVLTLDEALIQWHALDPDIEVSVNMKVFQALSLAFTEHYERAGEILLESINQDDRALDVYMQTAFQTENEARINDALTLLQTLVDKRPEDATLLMYIGYMHSFRKNYEEAIHVMDQAFSIAREHDDEEEALTPHFYFWYAAAHERTGDLERAEELFYKNLELVPDNPETLNYLAYMWAEKGMKLERALDYVTKALEKTPDSAAFLDTLGWVYYQQGRYEEAYREIQRAAELMPEDPTILEHLGDIYWKLDDKNAAIMNWKAAYRIDPENTNIRKKLEEQGVELDSESISSM